MRTFLNVLIGTLLLALALTTGAWANPKLQLYPLKVSLHFADDSGKVHTYVVTMHLQKLETLGCFDPGPESAQSFVASNAPEFYGMAYLGATCHGEKFPSRVSKSAGVKPPADHRSAMVVLTYKADNGDFHYSVFGDKRAGEYEMGTCPQVLHQTQAALLKQAAGKHAGQSFQGGDCVLRNRNALLHWTNR